MQPTDHHIGQALLHAGHEPETRITAPVLRRFAGRLVEVAIAVCREIEARYPLADLDDLSRARRITADNCARAIAERFEGNE